MTQTSGDVPLKGTSAVREKRKIAAAQSRLQQKQKRDLLRRFHREGNAIDPQDPFWVELLQSGVLQEPGGLELNRGNYDNLMTSLKQISTPPTGKREALGINRELQVQAQQLKCRLESVERDIWRKFRVAL